MIDFIFGCVWSKNKKGLAAKLNLFYIIPIRPLNIVLKI